MALTIGMFWFGRPWTKLEQSATLSWIAQGYNVKVFTYGKVENIPNNPNISMEDARDVWDIDPSNIRKHVKLHSYAPFADIFCYKMLAAGKGNIAKAAPDQYCLKPLPDVPYVFGKHARSMIADVVIKAPKGILLDTLEKMAQDYENDYDTVAWGLTGPVLMKVAVTNCGLLDYALPESAFCPIDPKFKLFPFTNIQGDDTLDELDKDERVLGIQIYATGVLNSFGGDTRIFEEPIPGTLYHSLLERFLC